MADDCIPTFPPVPPISGMKSAVAGFLAMFDSKFPKITEFQPSDHTDEQPR